MNLGRVSKTHKIENELYNSHTERLIYEIMGDLRVERFLESCAGKTLNCEEEWVLLKDFLRDESKRKSKMALKLSKPEQANTDDKWIKSRKSYYGGKKQGDEPESDGSYSLNIRNEKCNVCGGSECENKGSKGFEYIKCKEFRQMSHRERLRKIRFAFSVYNQIVAQKVFAKEMNSCVKMNFIRGSVKDTMS